MVWGWLVSAAYHKLADSRLWSTSCTNRMTATVKTSPKSPSPCKTSVMSTHIAQVMCSPVLLPSLPGLIWTDRTPVRTILVPVATHGVSASSC